jgi:hypothetical protein
MKNVFRFVFAAVLASVSVACTTGDYPGDEGQAGNAGSAGASGTAGTNSLPPGGGSGGSAPAECGYGKVCYGSGTCATDGTKCCGNKWSDPASAVCNPNQGGSGGSAPACGFGKQCSGNGTCSVDNSKCCGGTYRDPSSTACTGNGQGGSGGSNPTCGFGMVCSGSVSCSLDGTMCCGGVYRDPSSSACNPNQGTGATGGSSGAPACGIGKSCGGIVNGSTCPLDGSRCCNGTYVDKASAACGFNNEQGTAGGDCDFQVEVELGAGFVHVFIQGAGVVDEDITSLEGDVNGGPVSYVVSSPPVEWHTFGNCNAETAKGQSLNMTCSAARASICGSAKDCAAAFQVYGVRADGSYAYVGNDGPSGFKRVAAKCLKATYTIFEQNGVDQGKHVSKFINFDLTSKVMVIR